MGTLIVGQVDLNNPKVVSNLKKVIIRLIARSKPYQLRFKPSYYFEIVDDSLPEKRGWYIISDLNHPIYVGQTDNLNRRLNTTNNSLNNFANSQRTSDSIRNFIKKFNETKVFKTLYVKILLEENLRSELNLSTQLNKVDFENIEKFLNIFRFELIKS